MINRNRTSALTLTKIVFVPRVIGLAFVVLVIGAIFLQNEASIWSWILLLSFGFVWPHVAKFWAERTDNPFKTEQINLFIDAFFLGFLVPLISFNLVPSFAITGMHLLSVISVLGFKKALVAFIVECIGILAACTIMSTNVQLESDIYSILISFPVLIFYPLFIGNNNYQLYLKLSAKKKQLEKLSRTDALTGLNNRMYLEIQIEQVFKRNKRDNTKACLIFIDVDHFKAVNDTHGHIVGDEVLKKVADIIQYSVREVDICGRFGGEEFCILMPNTQVEEAEIIAERIRVNINKTVLHQEKQVNASISLGVAVTSNSMTCYKDWLALADEAQYRAKELGRNQTVVSEST